MPRLFIACSSPRKTRLLHTTICQKSSNHRQRLIAAVNSHITTHQRIHNPPRALQQKVLRATDSGTLDVHDSPHVRCTSLDNQPFKEQGRIFTTKNHTINHRPQLPLQARTSKHLRHRQFKEQSRPPVPTHPRYQFPLGNKPSRNGHKMRKHPKTDTPTCASHARRIPHHDRTQLNKKRNQGGTSLPEYHSIPQHDIVVLRSAADAGRRIMLQALEVTHQPLARRGRHGARQPLTARRSTLRDSAPL